MPFFPRHEDRYRIKKGLIVMKKAVDFLNKITPKDDVVIVFNNDADGICSCVLIKKLMKKKGLKEPYIIYQPMPTDKNLINKIRTTIPTKIIFLDLAVDQQQSLIRKVSGICDILIIDHHKITKDVNTKNIVHYNPRFDKPEIYQSTSYVTYKICSQIMEMSDSLWISIIGMIADYNLDDSMDLVKEFDKKNPGFADNIQSSLVAKIAQMIVAVRGTRALTCDQIVRIIETAKGMEEFYKSKDAEKLIESYKIIENEILSITLDAEKNSEVIGDLIFYRYKSKFGLRSEIATKISEKHPKKIVIIYEKMGDKMKLSSRNQSKDYNVSNLLWKASQGMKASAGGHDVAAGATVQVKDWEEFKNNLISLLK